MANLYLCNSGAQGNNGTEYLRYDASTKYIQAMQQDGTWLNVYSAPSLPLPMTYNGYMFYVGEGYYAAGYVYQGTITNQNFTTTKTLTSFHFDANGNIISNSDIYIYCNANNGTFILTCNNSKGLYISTDLRSETYRAKGNTYTMRMGRNYYIRMPL